MFHSEMQLAFGFGNVAMLGWLAAAAAPLLIHLWSRHRFREAPWAAMQFLLAAMRKNARRLQLQQWLLLAIRTLIIVLVVAAAAEPYGERLLARAGGRPKHAIFVIDDSYSMGYQDDDGSPFARAKQLAVQFVRDSRPADSFTIIRMAEPASVVLGREVVDHLDVVKRIEAMSWRYTGADLNQSLQLIEEAVNEKALRDESREVCFLSDFQKRTWTFGTKGSDVTADNPTQRIAALAKVAKVSAVNFGSSTASNLAVTNVASQDPVVVIGHDAAFDVMLQQFGDQPRSGCVVEFLVDGVPVAEKSVDVPPNGNANVQFAHRFQTAGEHTIEARAGGDQLTPDNARWLVVPVRESVRVLCVAGRSGAATYVASALNPSRSDSAPIQPIVVSDGDLADIELSEFDCVMLCNVAELTASEAERLARYTAAGGGLVVFLGDQVNPASYNTLAGGDSALLPATIGDIVSTSQFGLDPLEYRHPIVAPFRGRERAGLLTTPVTRYFRLNVPADRAGTQIAATTQSGDPFIVTSQFRQGRTVLVATDASLTSVDATTGEPWSNWPTWPSFLPVVRELLNYATGNRQQHWQQLIGSPLRSENGELSAIATSFTPQSANITVERPDKRVDTVHVDQTSSGTAWTYANTNVNGIYTVKGLPNGATRLFAVNVDPGEGDLEQVDLELVPPEVQVLDAPAEARPADESASVARAGWNLNLLWAAFVLLLIESFLAYHFGRGTL
jgi:hypothetical protein